MKITREVIYDLLPAYFANEVSADTRALVDEFLTTDPEFGRMAARFQKLLEDKNREPSPDPESEAAREKEVFDRARLAAELPGKRRTMALAWALASVFSFFIAFVTWNGRMGYWNPGVLLGVFYGVTAVLTFVASFFVRPDSRGRALLGLDDETLKSAGLK